MQWYLVDKKRLEIEIRMVEQNGVNFELYQDSNGNLLLRVPLSVSNHYHGDVRLIYDQNHPYVPMRVYVLDPPLSPITHHVRVDGEICYIHPEEWSPEWTAFAVYLTTIRFLEDFYSGRMNDYVPMPSVGYIPAEEHRPKRRGLFGKVLDAMFG